MSRSISETLPTVTAPPQERLRGLCGVCPLPGSWTPPAVPSMPLCTLKAVYVPAKILGQLPL